VKPDDPIALSAYSALADQFSALAPTKAENAYIEQPAMRAALGDVRGLDVLDAGCGPGILLEFLIGHGVRSATGADVTPRMLELASERAPQATLLLADLAEPLPIPDHEFDVIASSLALDYVRDWSTPLAEFRRVLRPGGHRVFSVQHPTASLAWYGPPSGFGVHYVESEWRGFGGEPIIVPDYYRSFDELINPVLSAGLRIERLTETQPIAALRSIDPDAFEKYSRRPTFMVIEASTR
jgi:SAM-dependent methyltransferase